jgi:CBS domain containing-hemolysin-like protein
LDTDIPSLINHILLLLLLLFLSAVCSFSETAITSTGKGKLLAMQEKHPRSRNSLGWLIANIQSVLTVTLVLNNLVNIAATTVATALAIRLAGVRGLWLSVLVMTSLIVVFSEILPKTVAVARPEGLLLKVLSPLRFISRLMFPVNAVILSIVRGIGKLFGVDLSSQHPFVSREEIEQMVTIGGDTGALEEEERKMIHGVIAFEETRAHEIMVPRMDVVSIPHNMTVLEAVEIFQEHGHSRLPIHKGSLDHVVGILYVKDLIASLVSGEGNLPVSKLKREAMFVPETMKIAQLFGIMKGKRIHMAVVVDEYGGTAGILTLEDLLEEIVGEIQDEYDEENPDIVKEAEGTYLVKGHVNLEDLSDALDYPFESEDVFSVAGFILALAGKFPDEGQVLEFGPWNIEVLEVEDHRIKLLRIDRQRAAIQEAEGDDE